MSAAFPDITPQHASVSPMLAEAINENLTYLSKMNKTIIELVQKVANVHEEAASSILSVVDTFKKKVNDSNKGRPQCQSESYVKFIHRLFEQFENQAKILQTVSSSFADCVVVPLQDVIEKKKEVWKTCFFYVGSFQQQIRNKEDDLLKRYKDYCGASSKIKSSSDGKGTNKQQLMYHNSHNTYLLRLSSVNSINRLLYTHVLPYVVDSIERNQGEINVSLRHHIKYMFTVQKETLKKIGKSVDKIDHATDKIDLVADLNKFVKSIKGQMKDKNPPQQEFAAPKNDQSKRVSIMFEPLPAAFVVNRYTQPSLQRRLAALQGQTSELVNNIASMRAGENKTVDPNKQFDDPALEELVELLSICDKEANLNVLLRQMELYTSKVTDFLGPISDNLLNERKHSKKSPTHQVQLPVAGQVQNPHEFIESRLMKPLHCFYCHKLITTFGKGYVCKACKMPVHKKCATNVPFCDGIDVKTRANSTSDPNNFSPQFKSKAESAQVYDLIDFESDDDYFDDDEFDDGYSDDDDMYNAPSPSITQYIPSPTIQQHIPSPNKPNILSKPLPKEPLPIAALMATNKTKKESPPPLPQRSLPDKPPPTTGKPKPTLKPALSTKPNISKKPVLAAKPNLPTPVAKTRTHCVSLYDYRSSQPETELSFTAGSMIEIMERTDADWWKGRFNNFEGYFPCSYVLEVSKDDCILRALYSFDAQGQKELTVDEGQILILLQHEDDWLKVKSIKSEGLIPSAYIEYL